MMTPASAIASDGLLGAFFDGPSWDRWRAVLRAAHGEALTPEEDALFREVAERDPPTEPVQELWCVAGRRAGKDSIASALAVVAAMGDYRGLLRPGERATILCLASTRDQALIVFRYILGYFKEVPFLGGLVLRSTDDTIELTNGAEIIVGTNSFRAVRGRSVVCCILDEVGYYRSDESANPDTELYGAVLPAMSTFPSALLIGISSPYRRQGLLYDKWRESYGKDDPECLVVRGASRTFNQKLRQSIVDRRLAEDPEAGASEYLAEWRQDLSDFLDRELVESAVDTGVVVRPPQPQIEYRCFADSAGGRGDSFTACIAHADGNLAVVDAVFEQRPPFNPSVVVGAVADLARSYGVARVTGDLWAAGWVSEAFAKEGISYEKSARDRSAIYLDVLPLFTSGRLRLVDNQRMIHQFVQLERRISKFGKDGVDHPKGGNDDLSNASAGAAVLVASDARPALIRRSELLTGDRAVEHVAPQQFEAVSWVGTDGQCAVVYLSYSPHEPAPMVIVDFDVMPWSAGVLDDVAKRLDGLCEAALGRSERLAASIISAVLHVPGQLYEAGHAAMSRAFAQRLDRPDARQRAILVNAINSEYLKDPVTLMLNGSAYISAGAVKLGALAVDRTKGKPLFGTLALMPGEAIDGDPLRVAVLLAVAQLDPEPPKAAAAKLKFG